MNFTEVNRHSTTARKVNWRIGAVLDLDPGAMLPPFRSARVGSTQAGTDASALKERIERSDAAPAGNKAAFTRYRRTLTIYPLADAGLERLLLDYPDFLRQPGCKIIKWERKMKVGYLSLQIGGKTRGVYVKQHSASSLARRVGSLFLSSAAMRSLSAAAALLRAGYATARPIAAVEYRSWGLLTRSLYLSAEVPGAKTVETFWRQDRVPLKGVEGYLKRRAFLKKLGRLLRSLHSRRIYHNDLKASNILVVDRGAPAEALFRLIDLQGLRTCLYVSRRRRIKNLAQLNRTLGVFLTKTERLFFLDAYIDFRCSTRTRKKELVKSTLRESRRQIERENLRSSVSTRKSRRVQPEMGSGSRPNRYPGGDSYKRSRPPQAGSLSEARTGENR